MVFGQCSGGSCRIVPYSPAPIEPAPIDPFTPEAGGRWVASQGGGEWGYWAGRRCLYRCYQDGRIYAADAHGFATGGTIELPTGLALPAGVQSPAARPQGDDVPTGVVPERISEAPGYSLTGRPCTREEAHRAIGAGVLSDDSDRWHLTAVGGPTLFTKVRAEVANLPEAVRAKLLVQCYGEADWPVAQFKLPAGVSLRRPSPGRESPEVGVIPAADFAAGTKTLADLLSLPDGPTPRPAPPPKPPEPKQPDRPGPGPNTPPAPSRTPFPIPDSPPWWAGAIGLLLYLTRR